MAGSMGNVDLNVKLEWVHGALCKQSYKAKHHTWWIRQLQVSESTKQMDKASSNRRATVFA